MGTENDLHNFIWLNRSGSDLKIGENALCIVPSNDYSDVAEVYKNTFSAITKLHTFVTTRGGKTDRFFTLYLLDSYKRNDEVHSIIIH